MTFGESVKTCFNKYANFSGRASRSEYWYFTLFNFIVSFFAMVFYTAFLLNEMYNMSVLVYILMLIFGLVVFLPNLAVTVRRFHDIGRNGMCFFVAFIPLIGGIICLVWLLTKGTEGENEYGPSIE